MKAVAADVIIVGSGVAGALVAERLARAGIGVAVLEAGSRIDRAQALARYFDAPVKTPESPYPATPEADFPLSADSGHWYRQSGPDRFKSTYLKAVGGTTWHWLGTCLRFLPNDFRLRSLYGQGADWPIGYDELEPFYLAAERALGVAGDSSEDLGSPRSGRFPLPAIARSHLDRVFERALEGSGLEVRATPQARNSTVHDGRPACCGSASCIPLCPVQAKYDATVHLRKAERLGAAVQERATATKVETDANGRIAAIRFRHPDLSEGIAQGRCYVMAAHAIETPRLLLHSRSERTPAGVANRSDQVGRNLMDHPIQLSWALAGEPVWPYRGPLSTSGIENLRDDAVRSARACLRIQIGNGGWTWGTGGALSSARALAESGLRGEALRNAVAEQASRHVELASLTEQLPHAGNRVVLDAQDKDLYGVPLARLHYAVGDYSRGGLAAAQSIHDRIFAKLGAAEVHHHPEFQGAGHIIGTCRMGDDPAHSVVDPMLRCHDHDNLHIIGSAVFPTSGTANPTLTIAALALRLAETLRAALTGGN
ncbi:MAG: GMC family oxidoreductase [Gammaproteobacteria bacterium]|nr:GMC family oxidoreductase [Gammaproteobacteria bacterium]